MRIIYVNVDMPASATLEDTLAETRRSSRWSAASSTASGRTGEARSAYANAGVKFTDTEPLYGDPYGQVIVSLNPHANGGRAVTAIVEAMRASIEAMPGRAARALPSSRAGHRPARRSASRCAAMTSPTSRPPPTRSRRSPPPSPARATSRTTTFPGRPQLSLRLDRDALRKAGLNAAQLARQVRIAVDGEVVAFTRDEGDKIEVRVRSERTTASNRRRCSTKPIALPDGQITRLGALVEQEVKPGRGFIRHYNLRRTVTVEANLDKTLTDTAAANAIIAGEWDQIRARHPGISLDFSGELEDIEESLSAMQTLFLLGVGLIYLILAAQFASYWQPLMILVTVPLAFTGVAFGLALSGNPLSLVHALRRHCADRHRGQLGDRPHRRRQRAQETWHGGCTP
jgi:multidrug efflux pump subunit AcrB